MYENFVNFCSFRGHRFIATILTIAAILICQLVIGLPTSHADVPLTGRPRFPRVAHLAADPISTNQDYVFFPKGTGTIYAYAPGGSLLFSIPPDPTYPVTDIIDVIDLNNDGSAEIVGINRGSSTTSPALLIYSGTGSLIQHFPLPLGQFIAPGNVKIYDLYPNPGTNKRRIAVAPDTFQFGYANSHTSAQVYFFDSDGSLLAEPTVPEGAVNGGVQFTGEIMTFPGVVAGDIANAGLINNVVVVCKSRILVFDQNGNKCNYTQFVDPGGSATNYNPLLDKPSGSSLTWEGRRYGFYELTDVNGNGTLELVVAGDYVNINNNIAGAVYEAYPVWATAGDGYIGHMWQNWVQHADVNYSAGTVPLDSNGAPIYQLGVAIHSAGDMNGDGVPDMVLTDSDGSGHPFVRAINLKTGAITGSLVNGIALDEPVLDKNASPKLPALVVYDGSTGSHKLYEFQANTYNLVQLSGATIPANSAVMSMQTYPSTYSLTIYNVDENKGWSADDMHDAVTVTRSNSVRAIVAYSPANVSNYTTTYCPSGISTWSAVSGVVAQSVNVASRPGTIVNVMNIGSATDYEWIINVESSCGTATNAVRTLTQSGSSLVANGHL